MVERLMETLEKGVVVWEGGRQSRSEAEGDSGEGVVVWEVGPKEGTLDKAEVGEDDVLSSCKTDSDTHPTHILIHPHTFTYTW